MAMTSTRPVARRRAQARLSRTSRFAALATAAMATMVLAEIAGSSTHGYVLLLVGALALAAYAAAARMWQCNCFESRLGVVVLSALIVVGQVMVAVVGSPGAGTASWTPEATLVVVLAFAAVGLVAADARERPTRPEHPYAL